MITYAKASFFEGDAEVVLILAEHKARICEILERVVDEPEGSLVLVPCPISSSVGVVAHNMSRLELEVYNGDNRPTLWDEARGNSRTEDVAVTLCSACPSLKTLKFRLVIRSTQVWGETYYLPPGFRN